MRAYIKKAVAAIQRDPHRRAIRIPRKELPRRSRATFVPVERNLALAH